jgi:hypothetical protein
MATLVDKDSPAPQQQYGAIDHIGNYTDSDPKNGFAMAGSIRVYKRPGKNYRLRQNYKSFVPDVWELSTEAKVKELFAAYDKEIGKLMAYYPFYEPDGWAVKVSEARKWLALDSDGKDAAINTEEFAAIAWEALHSKSSFTATNANKAAIDDLAQRILGNSLAFKKVYGILTGRKTKIQLEIQALNTEEALNAYVISLPTFEQIRATI